MKDTSSFWAAVHDDLDAGRNPVANHEVQDHLLENPELLDEFSQIVHTVSALSSAYAPPVARTRRRRRLSHRRVAGAIAAVILVGVAWFALPLAEEDPELVFPEIASDGEVIGYSCRIYTMGPEGRVDHEIEAGTLSLLEREVFTVIQPSATTPHGFPIRTETAYRLSRVRASRITE